MVTGFYAGTIRVCGNCKTSWEPFAFEDLPHGDEEPLASFKHPCGNCAFRKGSPEQADKQAWAKTMLSLSRGASFYCHKGVPIDPDSKDGFAYPQTRDGKDNTRKLRLCRGYLNAVVGKRLREFRAIPLDDEPWTDPVEEEV